MELITLIILIIVCGLGILLAFRLITFIVRIISIVILLIAIIAVAGSYFHAQAYVLPQANTAYVTLTSDGGFVITQIGVSQYSLDSAATAAYSREFIKPITEFNTSSYNQLKEFAKSDLFAKIDTVWVVNAINKTNCTQEKITSESKLFEMLCFDKTPTNAQNAQDTAPNFLTRIQSIVDISALNRVPIKASFTQWLKNYYLS